MDQYQNAVVVSEGVSDSEGYRDPGPVMAALLRFRLVVVAVLILLAVVLAGPVAGHFSSPQAWKDQIAVLDEKTSNVMGLTAGSAAVSAGLSAIPGDAGTPIAEKLMDLSVNFGIVLIALYLEKYLLTIFGLLAFRVLFPAALVMAAIALLRYARAGAPGAWAGLAVRVALVGAVVFATIPTSIWVADTIDATFETSRQTQLEAQSAKEAAEQARKGDGAGTDVFEFIKDLPRTLTKGVTDAVADAQTALNRFVESFAIMIVTSCAVPLLVVFFYVWAAHALLGVDVEGAYAFARKRARKMRPPRRASSAQKTE